jgi:Uma2 family endonuclease
MGGIVAQGEQRKKFTVDEVMRMVQTGVLSEDDRIELLDGDLYVMSPQDPHHASVVRKVNRALGDAYRGKGRFVVDVQLPLGMGRHSLPEPDVAVLRGSEDAFEDRHPTAAEAVLVVEVSDSTDKVDLRKAAIYARAGVPIYWRISIRHRHLEVYEAPARGHYASTRVLEESARVPIPGVRGRSLLVASILPGRKRPRGASRHVT